MRFRFSTFLLLIPIFLSAQLDIPIGGWKSYLPYRTGRQVTQSASTVYYATSESILTLDKTELSVDFLSKTDGLSNIGIRTIQYNQGSETLIIVYNNSVIDLVQSEGIKTLSDIKNFNNIIGKKEVNNIFVENEADVYLATSYGVSKLNVLTGLFEFTTFTGIVVNDVVVFDNAIYAATDEGIYSVAKNNFNIDDFGNWTFLGEDIGLPNDYSTQALEVYENQLYLGIDSILYRVNNGKVDSLYAQDGMTLSFMTAENKHLLVGYFCENCNGKVVALSSDGTFQKVPNQCTSRPLNAIEDQQGRIWFADLFRDFRYAKNLTDQNCRKLSFNSPYSKNVQEIAVSDNELWLASGGLNPTFNYLFRQDGFFSLIDGEWNDYSKRDIPAIKEADLFDFYAIAIHPENGNIYAGSFLDGLVEYDGENFTVFDDSNSSLNNAVGDESRTRVSGLAFDQDNNLWVSNDFASRPFSVYKNDGTWQSFSNSRCSGNDTRLLEVLIDENNFKWFVLGGANAGIMVYDTGENLEDTADDRCRVFTAANSNLPTNQVNDIALDLDGDIWVGTAGGVVVFQCGPTVFDDCDALEVITDQDETNLGLLLSGDEVKAVAIDGANNKWFGTTNGIFVQSPDGKDEMAHFTAENSPLLDNNIIDIAIRNSTGEVFIGTAQGLISYRGQATTGEVRNAKDIYAFPNPVRPDYGGSIAIKGLAQDANVKITDVNGQLIYETRAQGGQAIWNGNDYTGRRASTGVYLVFSTSKNLTNPDAAVAKILFIN